MEMENTLKEHDREIGKLFVVTERLAEGQEKMNDKMDKLIDNTNKYDVLMAQLVETTKHFQDSIGRAYKRIETIETKQTTTGCSVLQHYLSERKLIIEKYDGFHKDMKEDIKEFKEWRSKVVWFLVGKSVSLIVALIAIVWSMR